MVKNQGNRYCKICKSKLQKRGKTAAGTQRWKCVICGKSSTLVRADLNKLHELTLFKNWVLDKPTITQSSGLSRQTFWKKTKWCWEVIPIIPITGEVYKVIMVDAVYIRRNRVCIVARTPEYVIAQQWCDRESETAYRTLFKRIPAPEFLITDGNPSCIRASTQCWETTVIQRCVFHIFLYVRSKLSMNPKTEAGVKLLKWTRYLMQADTKNKAVISSIRFRFWEKDFKEFMNERTHVDQSKNLTLKHKYWYTHRNLRAAYRHIKNAFLGDQLWHYLERDIPNTNNKLEGGINARLKELRRCHRGISLEHEQRVFDWYLWSPSESPNLKYLKF